MVLVASEDNGEEFEKDAREGIVICFCDVSRVFHFIQKGEKENFFFNKKKDTQPCGVEEQKNLFYFTRSIAVLIKQ